MLTNINGIQVGKTGYGTMGLTNVSDRKLDDETALKALKAAVENGATLWNSADFYGRPEPLENITLLAKYFDKYPEDIEKVYLTVKGGTDPYTWMPDLSERNLRYSIEVQLAILGKYNKPDVYIPARVDPKVNFEDSAKIMAQYVESGKLKGVGLSEVNGDTIRKINKIVPVKVVEVEFSVWTRDTITAGTMGACAELGIPVIAYSPLGRGFLSGSIKSRDDVDPTDLKLRTGRFQEENLTKNYAIVDVLKKIGDKYGATPAQIALEWIRYHSGKPGFPTIVPIPGSSKPERIAENTKEFPVTDDDIKVIEDFMGSFETQGHRYAQAMENILMK